MVMSGSTHKVLVYLLLCNIGIESVLGQVGTEPQTCYSSNFFHCASSAIVEINIPSGLDGRECCHRGHLSFLGLGDGCFVCNENGICFNSETDSQCRAPFPGVGVGSIHDCCLRFPDGGAYINYIGACLQCSALSFQCFEQVDCAGSATSDLSGPPTLTSLSSCCEGPGLSYSFNDQCFLCNIFGWTQDVLIATESVNSHSLSFGFIKGGEQSQVTASIGATSDTAGFGRDFIISGTEFTVDSGEITSLNVIFISDGIGGEPVESATLTLTTPFRALPVNTILRDTLELSIIDNDLLEIGFLSSEASVNENEGPLRTALLKNLRIARPITAMITPLLISETSLVGSIPMENRAAHDDINISQITVEFPADETGEAINIVPVTIPISDDKNLENNEFFQLVLSSLNPRGLLTTVPRDSVLCEIIDNDTPRRVNDTVAGDPVMTVPLFLSNTSMFPDMTNDQDVNLCFEIRGQKDSYFNLISDTCVSVNAHYSQPNQFLLYNVINEITVRAPDLSSSCQNIMVSASTCTASVNGAVLGSSYMSAGISVRQYPNRVRITVPNCQNLNLVMWVICEIETFEGDKEFGEPDITITVPVVRLVVARGLVIRQIAHGLVGQFWNIPVDIKKFTGLLQDGSTRDNAYITTVHYPEQEPRQFLSFLVNVLWDGSQGNYCLYSGNSQGGAIAEIESPNDSVIEGEYTDYIVSNAFAHDYKYSQFDQNKCK